jgi:hypothetical protein
MSLINANVLSEFTLLQVSADQDVRQAAEAAADMQFYVAI